MKIRILLGGYLYGGDTVHGDIRAASIRQEVDTLPPRPLLATEIL